MGKCPSNIAQKKLPRVSSALETKQHINGSLFLSLLKEAASKFC